MSQLKLHQTDGSLTVSELKPEAVQPRTRRECWEEEEGKMKHIWSGGNSFTSTVVVLS